MSDRREPAIAVEDGHAWLKCTTPGCRKRLAEIVPGTRVAAGAVILHCRGCKTEYRFAPGEPSNERALHAAS